MNTLHGRHIEDVDQSTKQLKTAFENINDMHLRKLQAISDAVKMMHLKTQDQKKPIVINANYPLKLFRERG